MHTASQGWHDGKHNIIPWIEYIWGILISAHKEYVSKVKELEMHPSKSKTERVEDIIRSLPGEFSVKDVLEKAPDISREMVKKVITAYKKDGKLITVGAGRSAKLRKI